MAKVKCVLCGKEVDDSITTTVTVDVGEKRGIGAGKMIARLRFCDDEKCQDKVKKLTAVGV